MSELLRRPGRYDRRLLLRPLMNTEAVIEDWMRRLIELASHPHYVFRDTPQALIDAHFRRLTTFVGYTPAEVEAAEARLRLTLPPVFREYWLRMAKSPGDLWRGSNLARLDDLTAFRDAAQELMSETDPAIQLPCDAIVFLFQQGYTFLFIGADDPQGRPMQYVEGSAAPQPVAASFQELVERELDGYESNNRKGREVGGYYLTLHPGGGATEWHPALTDQMRPAR